MTETIETKITDAFVANAMNRHNWAATGVSDYPPRDPLVGQSRFFTQYRQFIHTIDQEADNFAHVFAAIGDWGLGKSRLGHELIAQINDCSKGWYVRDESRELINANLFDDEEKRDSYLALYLRYSQVASDYQNSDNWFGYGLYMALLPLATKKFNSSIQSEIAKQALRRLEPMGFDSDKLAQVLQLDKNHSEESLYYDDHLVTELVQAAYSYLNNFGIKYILVVLDELETVAEAASYELEQDEAKRLDGQAIRLIGKAIKEEDPRRKLPWLRYVALCSPLLGQQLREIQSTARRFELVELETNAFADVVDYVGKLREQSRLPHVYPDGLVQAAYMMSGANFGWFNVIMANVDVLLDDYTNAGKVIPEVGELFDGVLQSSGRVKEHVLDYNAIEGIDTSDQDLFKEARRLLYGQLPVTSGSCNPLTKKLVDHFNEYDEPVASFYYKVKWEKLECRRALTHAKFIRDKEEWFYPSVEQGIVLEALLENLKTFAIHEPEDDCFLIPLEHGEFKHLVQLLYNHPAAEYGADALWKYFFDEQKQLDKDLATHVGPSVAMLLRLDLRYRSQQNSSMIFRDPDYSAKHSQGMKEYEKEAKQMGADPTLMPVTRLTGLFRLLDKNWQYAEPPWPNKVGLTILATQKTQGRSGGLQYCDGLKLHPKNQAWFAWVDSKEQLNELHKQVVQVRDGSGRIPVMAFTASIGVNDYYVKGLCNENLKDDILLYHLNSSENDVLEHIGLLPKFMDGFDLNESLFTTKFKNRLNAIRDFAYKAIHTWRKELSARGLIAWPLRSTAKINSNDRTLLKNGWQILCIENPKIGGLYGLNSSHAARGVDAESLGSLFGRLNNDPKVLTQGYDITEQAGLFTNMGSPSQVQAEFPPFLAKITNPAKNIRWDYKKAQSQWYWGYLWSATGLTAKNVFDDWMWLGSQINLLKANKTDTRDGEWVSVSLSSLENRIQKAKNWLDGDEDNGYKSIVKQLETVYGSDRIHGFFAPKGSLPEGTQTTHALESIKKAREKFDELKLLEEQKLKDAIPQDQAATLAQVVKKRRDILKKAGAVFSEHAPEINLDKIRTVSLEDRSLSLSTRIETARLFADRVVSCDKQVTNQVIALNDEIVNDPDASSPFPRRLFTLSLATISHIFDGVLRNSNDGETSSGESGSSSDTLLHYLRDLRIDKATERLELLGHEVGYDLVTDQVKRIEDIDGYILSTFRSFKQRYLDQHAMLGKLFEQVKTLKIRLEPMPEGYPVPEHAVELEDINNKLHFVEDAFEDLDEKIDMERDRFSVQARKGIFNSIQDVPDRLLKPIQGKLAGLGGQVNTIDLRVRGFQKDALNRANGIFIDRLNPLFKAMGKGTIPLMQSAEIDDLTLHEIEMAVDIRLKRLQDEASVLLNGTGVNLDRWLAIATALLKNEGPDLTAEEQKMLVSKGILKVQVAFGG